MPSADDLNEFMSEAASSNGPVKFKFEPIWEVLFEVYNRPCLQSHNGQDDENCKMLQRAVTLQAHYEGKLAYKCQNEHTPEFGVIQKMIYAEELVEHGGADLATGVKLFACWNHKTGCYNDDDCHKHWLGEWHRHACFMYGQNAISTEEIPFSNELRDVVIGDKDQAPYWADQEGNNFCSWSMKRNGQWGCLCRTERGWHIENISAERDRGIYVQSLSPIMQKKTGKRNLRAEVSVV